MNVLRKKILKFEDILRLHKKHINLYACRIDE